MNKRLWFAIACTLLLLLAGSTITYFRMVTSPATTSIPITPLPTGNGGPTATIDPSSLISRNGTPLIRGNATDARKVSVLIYAEGPKHDDHGVYGISQGTVSVTNGAWAFQVGGPDDFENAGLDSLPSGAYEIDVYNYTGMVPPGSEGLSVLFSGAELATGSLTIARSGQAVRNVK
jgi:hypothetical protein